MSWPTRTVCSVLNDMRECYKTYNFSAIGSLIEEVQMLVNRMEARLENAHDFEQQRDELRKIKTEIKQKQKELDLLNEIGGINATSTSPKRGR